MTTTLAVYSVSLVRSYAPTSVALSAAMRVRLVRLPSRFRKRRNVPQLRHRCVLKFALHLHGRIARSPVSPAVPGMSGASVQNGRRAAATPGAKSRPTGYVFGPCRRVVRPQLRRRPVSCARCSGSGSNRSRARANVQQRKLAVRLAAASVNAFARASSY